jgi:hypothetical protein
LPESGEQIADANPRPALDCLAYQPSEKAAKRPALP